MSEKNLFTVLKKIFKESGKPFHLQRHEDSFSVGIPDVSFGVDNVNGWIELKDDVAFPLEYKTHFQPQQPPWLTSRGRAGGNCFVLHRLGDIYMLIPYQNIMIIQGTNQETAFKYCDGVWTGKLGSEILELLTKRQTKPHTLNGVVHI